MRVMSLSSVGGEVVADGRSGVRAKTRLRGTGLPPVATQWFEGAGDGAVYRTGRVLARTMDLDLKVYGKNREQVRAGLSLLGKIFAPGAGDVRLTVDLDGDPWFVDVRRTGGGDWSWDSDTDGSTFVKTIITVQAGDPYWTRVDEEQRSITPGGLDRGLLNNVSLSQLAVSTTTALGEVDIENTGDVEVFPRTTIWAPFTGFELVSPKGERVLWGSGGRGTLGEPKTSGFITVDHVLGTVEDETGQNLYRGLGNAPRFWALQPGTSRALITAFDGGAGTRIDMLWQPKRWVMF